MTEELKTIEEKMNGIEKRCFELECKEIERKWKERRVWPVLALVSLASASSGTYVGVQGLAGIISDIAAKNPPDAPNYVWATIGALLVHYGISVVERGKL